ncbi:hypothetical protein BDW60DRAFT_220679 [Aspergillus nidulans var. acristatus]
MRIWIYRGCCRSLGSFNNGRWQLKNCKTLLEDIEKDLDLQKGQFQQKVNYVLYKPRESFQVFVLKYLTFFSNAMGPECNNYTCCVWPFCRGPKLKEDLYKKLNTLVCKANAAIKGAAEDLKGMGMIYIEGIQDIYNGHCYCEPGASSKINEYSPGDTSNSWSAENVDLAQGLLDFIFPGQGKLVSDLSADGPPPWEWEGAEKYLTLQSLLDAMQAAADMVVTGNQGQQIAIVLYINPLGDLASWERLLAYNTQKVSILVANKSVIDRAASQGKKIISYQQFTTQLGLQDLADWALQIKQDIDKWYELYRNSLSSIFFDKGWPECSPNNIYTELYIYINNYIKQKHPDTMNMLLTFKNSYKAYQSMFILNNWTLKNPQKIWHIIYKVPQDQILKVAALAKSRNISNMAVSSSDYSSVTLTWSSVMNALGYAVYINSKQVLELPPLLTRATVGMIKPGTSGISFKVWTVLSSVSSRGSSRTILASMKSLPEDSSITNIGFTQNGGTITYTADMLVPYVFVRLFISKNQPDPSIRCGWLIQAPPNITGGAQHQIINYLVKGNNFYLGLYKYAGSWYKTTLANVDWTCGYTYIWVILLGGTDTMAKEYIVQGQGYTLVKNVFKGTLHHFSTV